MSTKFEIVRTEHDEYIKTKFDKYKSEISSSVDMKILTLSYKKYTSSYDQPSSDLIKFPLLNSPDFHPHASKFIKHISFMNLEGNTLFKIQK